MNVEDFLRTRDGGWYTSDASRLEQVLKHELTGEVFGSSRTNLYETFPMEDGVHQSVIMEVSPISSRTERERLGRWRIEFFPGSESVERYPEVISRTDVAFHEAGHALVAGRLGCRVSAVSIIPQVQEDGTRSWGRVTHRFTQDDRVSAIIAFAGPYVETVIYTMGRCRGFMENDYPLQLHDYLGVDGAKLSKVLSVMEEIFGGDALDLRDYVGDDGVKMAEVFAVTEDLVMRDWPAIKKIAERLVLKGYIRGIGWAVYPPHTSRQEDLFEHWEGRWSLAHISRTSAPT